MNNICDMGHLLSHIIKTAIQQSQARAAKGVRGE